MLMQLAAVRLFLHAQYQLIFLIQHASKHREIMSDIPSEVSRGTTKRGCDRSSQKSTQGWTGHRHTGHLPNGSMVVLGRR